ncbi:unnamed protein product, partial [Ectocarpus sp. 12 AP-2014]
MGRVFWMTSVVAATVVIYGLNEGASHAEKAENTQLAHANVETHVVAAKASDTVNLLPVKQSGFALATAAFGMSALQPETYDGDMVASIIAASPLEEVEKVQLTSNLQEAEQGDADLHIVLSDVRSALAV